MKYVKHYAFYHAGDYKYQRICLCPRVTNHIIGRRDAVNTAVPLFDLENGEMVTA